MSYLRMAIMIGTICCAPLMQPTGLTWFSGAQPATAFTLACLRSGTAALPWHRPDPWLDPGHGPMCPHAFVLGTPVRDAMPSKENAPRVALCCVFAVYGACLVVVVTLLGLGNEDKRQAMTLLITVLLGTASMLIVLDGDKVDKEFMIATAALGLTSMIGGAALRPTYGICCALLCCFLVYIPVVPGVGLTESPHIGFLAATS